MLDVDGAVEEEAEADGVGEVHDGLGVDVGVDHAGVLAGVDEVGEAGPPVVELRAQHGGDVGVAPGGDERLEQQRRGVVVAVALDEVPADGVEDVGGVALEAVLGEELVELVGGRGLDGGGEQLGLAGEAAVDGTGRQPRSPGDLGHAGAVVALLGEHLGGGDEQPTAGVVRPGAHVLLAAVRRARIGGRIPLGHAAIITVIIAPSTPTKMGLEPLASRSPHPNLEGSTSVRPRASPAGAR